MQRNLGFVGIIKPQYFSGIPTALLNKDRFNFGMAKLLKNSAISNVFKRQVESYGRITVFFRRT